MSNEKSKPGRERGGPGVSFRLELTGDFLLLASLTGYFCGGRRLAALTLASAVHELGHAALLLFRGQVPLALRMDAAGFCLRCPPPESDGQELLRSFAGPAAGLLLALLLGRSAVPFLRLSGETSLALSLLNLLPASCLDGGRLLRSLGNLLLGPVWAERIAALLDWVCILLFALLGFRGRWDGFLWSAWLLYHRLRRLRS